MRRLPILLIFCGAAFAQNSDLGFLLGISGPKAEVVTGSTVSVTGAVGAHFQINYALQLKETTKGRLYLELPLLIGGESRTTVSNGVFSSSGANIYFTPGVRWNIPVHDRVSVYVAAGVGPASFIGTESSVTAGRVSSEESSDTTFCGAIGGGLDLRLTRLISLRGEARDFNTVRTQGGLKGRLIFGFGLGFHW